jgi:hypothetical protein
MAVAVTNSTLTSLNANLAVTENASTQSDVGGTEVFTVTPTKSGGKLLFVFEDGSTAATALPSYSIAAGDLWAANAITGTFGNSAAAGGKNALEVDTARVLTDDGTILITLSPGNTTAASLKDTHHAKLTVYEMI